MKRKSIVRACFLIAGFISSPMSAPSAVAEALIYGIQIEQAEYRVGSPTDVFAWDFDALIGTDEVKFVWRSEAEYAFTADKFETLENQLRLQKPISDFFDIVAGIRVDTPSGKDRVQGVVGLHGLAKQFVEVDADFFVGDHPSIRLEAEYEALITNRLIVTPSIEVDLPLNDDRTFDRGAFAPTLEVGIRAGYDLIDRALSPYIGVHYERSFGKTANIRRSEGEDAGSLFFVAGARMVF